MSAYMDLNDVPAGGNRWLLTEVLKEEWGFPGFVVSDAKGVGNLVLMGLAKDRGDAARRALAAGLDMEMASGAFPEHLARLVREGAVPTARLDDAVRRVLAVKVRMGLFERPYADETRAASVLADPAHRAEARLAARRSMLLLRNEGKALPLSKALTNLAVIGPLADSRADTEGSWMVFGHVPAAVTVLEGLRAKLPGAKIAHAPGPEIRRQVPSIFDDLVPGPPKAPPQTP
jgi:beta-glucosidase